MQQQHLTQMAAYYPGVTTDHIQQYLDENKSLILKIVESQNSGKMTDCAENQARLQRNLMYLAAIADSQPQPPTMHSQYGSSSMMQSSGHYMQQSQMTPQSSMLYGSQAYPSLQMHGMMLQSEPHGFPDFIRGEQGLERGMGSQSKHEQGRDGDNALYLKSSDHDG